MTCYRRYWQVSPSVVFDECFRCMVRTHRSCVSWRPRQRSGRHQDRNNAGAVEAVQGAASRIRGNPIIWPYSLS
jgi:hypothetical protein